MPAPTRSSRPAIRMSWVDLLFLHWPIDAEELRPLLPPELEIDLFDNQAWIGLIPFRMADVKPRVMGVRVPPIPEINPSMFPECNVRTYVRYQGRPGVWFFSLDASPLAAVLAARFNWKLNYCWSRFAVNRDGDHVDYSVKRRAGQAGCVRATHPAWPLPEQQGPPPHSHVRWTYGATLPTSRPGSLEHFLTERYSLYTRKSGRIQTGRMEHDPWKLRQAELHELDDELIAAAGVNVSGDPVVMGSDGIETIGYPLA